MVHLGACWCNLRNMSTSARSVRQSVSLPSSIARRVQAIAKRRRTSANRVLVDLIESGLEAKERERELFFDVADRLATATDPSEQKRLKEELARLTFGEP